MSGRLVGEMFRCAPADLTPAERLVLLALANLARDSDRTARQGSDANSLAYMTCLGVGTVRNALSSLTNRAIIQPLHKARKGLSQDYRITPLSEHHRASKGHSTVTQNGHANGHTVSLHDDAIDLQSVIPR
jgi:hypothetical protein